MFLKQRVSGSERHSVSLYPLTQGLRTLHSVAGRDRPSSEQRLRQATHGLGRSALALSRCLQKTNVPQAVPSLRGFVSEIEEMRKAFLARPGCPQFSTKATSVSQLGSGSSIDLPRVGGEDWLLDRRDSDRSMDGRPLLGSKSAFELSSRRRSSAQTPSPTSSSAVSSHRPPWYISVIHEKERSLLVLGEEMRRFSELEAKLQKKDQEILALEREMEALRRQLKSVLRSKGVETPSSTSGRESLPGEDGLAPARLTGLRIDTDREDLQLQEQKEAAHTPPKPGEKPFLELGDGEKDQAPGAEPSVGTTGDAGVRDIASRKGTVQEEEAEEEVREELEEEDEENLTQEEDSSWGPVFSMTESFEDELLAQLEEYERALLEFRNELDAARTGYYLALGTIGSLQRQVTFLESQLGKVNLGNEALQKELGDRKRQLQAMSEKFSRLREDKKHLEMMGLIEKDNFDLRQRVWDLESDLSKRELSVAQLVAKVSELQAQVSLEQEHGQRWKQLQEDARSRTESVQQAEQQARVALESSQARLERLRSRIIQAAFNVPGMRALSTEISDNDILEALQRVISERNDYYNQLKQTGVRVPPPQQVEILPSKSKKILSK